MTQGLVQDTGQFLAFGRMVRGRLCPAVVLKHDLRRLAVKIGPSLQKAVEPAANDVGRLIPVAPALHPLDVVAHQLAQ